MRKLFATFIITILLISTAGCTVNTNNPTSPTTEPTKAVTADSTVSETEPLPTIAEITEDTQPATKPEMLEHLELKVSELPLDSKWFSDDLEKVGLERTKTSARAKGFITEKSKAGKDIRIVHLLGDYERYGNGLYHDLFLTVQADTKVIFKDLTYSNIKGAYSERLHLNDIDGDGIEEIIIHQCVDMFGGAGQYLARIFKVENEEIKEVFCSLTSDGNKHSRWGTGFKAEEKEDFQLEISNTFTGYKELIDLSADKESYIRSGIYSEEGNVLKHSDILTDTFLSFIPKDIDSDGICEIYCEQYTSHLGHAQHIGHAISILKYNTDSQSFEVIDAWFDPAYRLE